MNEFIAMGGYGAYVWSAYAVCFLVLGVNIIRALVKTRRTMRELRKRLSGEQSS